MIVSGLFIYPIKSAGGISVSSAEVTTRGLHHDRRWMVVDDRNGFLTQRDFPGMALIRTRIGEDFLEVQAPGMPGLRIPFDCKGRNTIRVTVWGDHVDAVATEPQVDSWFSEYLGIRCRLVYMPDDAERTVRRLSHASKVSFADAYPFLLMSEGSLADLNSRLRTAVPMNRFRPNIVVRGCEPFAEDEWKEILIGPLTFRVAKPCVRCVITTVDQETGRKGDEPLRTLAGYRKRDGEVMFGQNLIHTATGILHTGAALNVIQANTQSSISHSKENTS